MQSSSRQGTTQTIAFDASVTATNAFSSQTRQVRLVANSACNYRVYSVGETATATAADPFLPANWYEYVTVSPGQKISALKAASEGLVTATAGRLWITEMV